MLVAPRGLGTFEMQAPSWEEWDAARLPHSRLVIETGDLIKYGFLLADSIAVGIAVLNPPVLPALVVFALRCAFHLNLQALSVVSREQISILGDTSPVQVRYSKTIKLKFVGDNMCQLAQRFFGSQFRFAC
jgi:hypothetical protein